ncbi:MAG: glycosyl hydrolase [Fimbriimonadaceae bacterium]
MFASLVTLALGQSAPASFRNILIAATKPGMSPCEPSIAVSKKDPRNIVAGVILDREIYTKDGGKTWTEQRISSPHGTYGDPAVISDHEGNFYFFTLSNGNTTKSWLDRMLVQKSNNGGESWKDSDGIGLNVPKQQDKQWPAVHPTKQWVALTWTQFDKYGTSDPKFASNILFSLTQDGGSNWSAPIQINDISGDCVDDDGTTEGAVPAIGHDGTIYVAWANQGVIWFDRTSDQGKTWLAHDIPIAKQFGGWNMDIPGINRSNGMPVLMRDNSNGPNKGSLYVVYGDQRNGAKDSDIQFLKSTDGGKSWSKPMTVNKDGSGRHQFLPWMAVDDTTGYIYLVYYDRRAYEDNKTDVIVAFSKDGGTTFTERVISENPFLPESQVFFGDYNNISAHGGIIAPIWTRMDDKKTSVWTAVIKHADLEK